MAGTMAGEEQHQQNADTEITARWVPDIAGALTASSYYVNFTERYTGILSLAPVKSTSQVRVPMESSSPVSIQLFHSFAACTWS